MRMFYKQWLPDGKKREQDKDGHEGVCTSLESVGLNNTLGDRMSSLVIGAVCSSGRLWWL